MADSDVKTSAGPSNVLVIAPHMDDEVLGCGGTIVRHVQAGDTVTVVFMAHRVYDHRFDEAANKAEQDAALKAKAVLGYHAVHFLDLPDERLDGHVQDILMPLEPLYAETRPDIVYSCFYGDNNQDHRGVFDAVRILLRPWSAHPPATFLLYEVPSSTDQSPPIPSEAFLPNHYVNIADTIEAKVEALGFYEREARTFPHPRSEKGVRVYAEKRGMECGFDSAEAFMQMRRLWT